MSEDKTIHDAAAAGIDPAYAEMLKRGAGVQEAEERVGREYPRSDYFIFEWDGQSFRTAFDEKIPQARFEFKVLEGPEGSVGIHYNADLSLIVSKKTRDDKDSPLRDKTPAEIEEQEKNLVALGKRLQRVLGLDSFLPPSPTEAGVKEWLAEACAARPTVVMSGYSRNGFATAVLGSIRHPDDPAKKGKKLVQGKTALQFAEEQLAKEAAGPGARRTLGSQGGATY